MQAPTTKTDRSLKVFHVESAAAGVENAGDSYQSASLIASGADGQSVAMLSAAIHMVASMLYIKVPVVIEKVGSRRRAVILLGFFDAATWAPLVIISLFIGPINPNWLILIWVINLIPALLAAPIRDNWLVDIIPASNMGRYLSIRSAISNSAYLATFFFMGRMLDLYHGQIFTGFTIVFLTAFTGAIGCFSLYFLARSPAGSNNKEVKLSVRQFFNETRNQSIGRFIVFCALVWFSVELSTPFFSVYILTDLHFSYTQYTSLFVAAYLARIVSVTFWGRYSDRYGNLKAIAIIAPLIFIYRFLMLTSDNIIQLLLIQMLNGAVWAGFDLCSYNLIYKAAPPEKRLQYTIFHRALMTMAMSIGALSGMALVNIVPSIGGHNILGLFLLSGIVGFVVIAVIFPTLKNLETVVRTRADQASPLVEPWTAPAFFGGLRQGLYHSPQAWAQFNNKVKATERTPAIAASEQGLFRRPQVWRLFNSPLRALEPITGKKENEVTATRPIIVNKPQFWTRFTSKLTVTKDTSSGKTGKAGASREGLLNKPGEWAKYSSKPANSKTAGTHTKKNGTREALYNKPGTWDKFSDRSTASKPISARSYTKLMKAKRGLYNKPGEWAEFGRNNSIPINPGTLSRIETVSSRPALLNKPQAWAQHYTKAGISEQNSNSNRNSKTIPRRAMLNTPQAWTNFGSEIASSQNTSNERNPGTRHTVNRPRLYPV